MWHGAWFVELVDIPQVLELCTDAAAANLGHRT